MTTFGSSLRTAAAAMAILMAGCRGEEKAKPAPVAAPPRAKPPEAPPAPPRAPPPAEKAAGKVVKQVATAQGTLKVLRHGTGKAAEYSVALGERELVSPRLGPIEVAAVRATPARLVLLRLRGTVKACPALFRVVEASQGNEPRVSDEFGNCNPRPKVAAVTGGWKISFLRSGKATAKAWVYAGGEVLQLEAKKKGSKAQPKKAEAQPKKAEVGQSSRQ